MKRFELTIFIILTIFSQEVQGQQTARGLIEGRVAEAASNNPVPFANVVIYGTNMGTLTDESGNFSLKNVEPGYIKIAVTCIGYETYFSEDIYVTNAKKVTLEIPLQETQVKLEEVTVKASPFRRQEESPVSLRRIEISEIEKNPGGNRDISKVIQSFPGVGSGVAYRNDLIVRGGGPAENRFYLDGIEIPNLNHFATQGASGGPVGIINVDLIRGVDFYSGAFPSNRGNALSSVLEFRQIDGNAEKMKFKMSVGSSDLALTIDGPAGKNTTFIASVRRSYLQFLFSALNLPFLPTYNDFQFKVRTRFNPKNEISFIGLGAYDKSVLNLKANDTPEQRYILGYLPENTQWNYTFGANYKHYLEHGYLSFVLSRNYLNNQAYKYVDNEPELGKTYDYKSSEAENHLRLEHNGHIPGIIKYVYGIGLDFAEYTNNSLYSVYVNDSLNEVQINSDLSMLNYGFFGQASKGFFNEKLTVSLGFRADGNNYASTMNNPLKQISPRVSLSYSLTPNWFLNANAGTYYQRPPYTMLGFRNNAGELVNRNNGIKYIRADHLVGGVEFRKGENYQFTFEAFYKRYQHYPFSLLDSISLASKGDDFGVYGSEAVSSIARGKAYGFEILGRVRDLARINLILSYTYVISKSLNSDQGLSSLPAEVSTTWDNRHILNITATKKYNHNWTTGFKWRLVGGTPYTPYDYEKSSVKAAWDVRGMAYPDYALYNTQRLKVFHQLDIRIDKQYFFPKWSLNFYLDVQNCYNFKSDAQDMLIRTETLEGHPVDNDPYTDERGIQRYRLSYLPSEGQGTILPTIGIIVEF
jgi:outer membrane receptor for ferrienterochelin and colicin